MHLKPKLYARELHPSEHAEHDAFVNHPNVDNAAFGDWLAEHGHSNAAIVQSAATSPPVSGKKDVGYKTPEFWTDDSGTTHNTDALWDVDDGGARNRANKGYFAKHVYGGTVDTEGTPYLHVTHRAVEPYDSSFGGAASTKRHPSRFFETPVHSLEHLHQLTEDLPEGVRDGLRRHLRRSVKGYEKKLARDANTQSDQYARVYSRTLKSIDRI